MKARLHLSLLLLLLVTSLLAGGCCCPLSGRYCDYPCCQPQRAGCPNPDPECLPTPTPGTYNSQAECPPDSNCCEHGHCLFPRLHCGSARGLFSAWFGEGVPSQQHPDYYSPPAKFHPVPTRPAFEPLTSYPPLVPTYPGMNNPLRASASPPGAPLSR